MIVICTRCQSRFRVADEKIGPRGAKVRCSKCQTVFAVHRDLGSLPSPAEPAPRPAPRPGELDLERRPGRAAPPPPAPPAPPAADDPFAQDPFQAAPRGDDSFADAGSPPPFAAAPPEPDPFGEAAFAAPPPRPPAPEPAADDPFASPAALLAQAADPFAASVTPRAASGSALPVTDLSDLLGEPTPAAVRGPRPPARPAPPPIPPPVPPPGPAGDGAEDGIGLALEERLTPPPMAAAPAFGEPEPPPPPVGFQPGAFGGASDPGAFEPSALEGGHTDELSLALATEPTPPAPSLPPVAAPQPPPRRAPRAAAPAQAPIAPAPAPEPAPPEAPVTDRIPGGRAARVRSLAVNAAALAALLLVAFALLAVWRSGGRLELASLRPAAVLAGLRGAGAEPFAAEGVTSGLYERDAAPPLLFVRGTAVARAPAPVSGLRVRVELVRGGAVIARGEALAGAVPGAEELFGTKDAESLAAVARAVAARAPREVRPGDALPFLVAISDHPADLAGASLRVSVEAAGAP
jgi:predicted Zn finger-like uncharacterized protein